MESVVALFREPQQAQGVLQALQQRGFDRDHLGFALTDVVAEDDIAQRTGVSPEAGEPAGSASVIRGMIGGTLAGLALTVPIWLLLLAFPVTRIYQHGGVLGILFGVIGGAALGGLFGALAGSDHGDYVKLLRRMGVPAAQAEKFYQGLKGGHVLVIARDPSGARADEALSLMRKHGAVKLDDVVGGGRLQSERTGQDGH
ncbi:general stress protein [Deinococcus multiflagellatus]|uniref:General stress protein n=1 Tax=Deinococcus multiflagellatus TaxID=1656887 RepID=A0ABW1ZKB3_9DEIO|nr:general stress protein [Deinococcus multiflagellatus]MBZ9712422.1 general stress protein [Deinococcus multiflagellatus]